MFGVMSGVLFEDFVYFNAKLKTIYRVVQRKFPILLRVVLIGFDNL
jgi:hypothetical protein